MPYDRSAFVTRTAEESIAFDFMVDSATAYHADKLFAPKPVDKAEKKFFQVDLSKLKYVNVDKGTMAEPDTVDEQLFASNVTLREKKLGGWVNPRDERDADIKSLLGDARKIKQITNQLLIAREVQAATLVTSTANYPSALTSAIASGSRWNEAGGDPEADMITAQEAVRNYIGGGLSPCNAAVMDVACYRKLQTSPNLRTRTQYTKAGPLPQDLIQAYLGLDYLFINTGRYSAKLEGITEALGGFYGADNVVLFKYNPSVALEDVSFGVMALMEQPFWVTVTPDPKRNGPAGAARFVQVGSEWALAPGMVESSSSTKFVAGYLLRTVVA
jgi:hypothetical protein